MGPGKDKVGAVWVAQRVPDGHVSVNANASTIKKVDLAKENEWWNEEEDFMFCYAYAPKSRTSIAARRRE